MERKSWDDFRSTGLLWFINSILHTFGWVIVLERMSDTIDCYPARTKHRGFSEPSNTAGYQKISQYMKDNAEQLYNESLEK